MSLEARVTAKRRNWKRFGLKALLAGIVVLASPFITFKTYEGKPWQFLFWGSTNSSVCGRYVVEKYASVWGDYGMKKFRMYRDFDDDGVVDQVWFSTDYPSWMKNSPLSKFLPKDDSEDHSKYEVWLRGAVAQKFLSRYFMPPRHCYDKTPRPPEPPLDEVPVNQNQTNLHIYQTPEEVDKSGAKPLFDKADKLFDEWYGKEPVMPYEPTDKERWFLYRQDD